jgi:hypothetical protein
VGSVCPSITSFSWSIEEPRFGAIPEGSTDFFLFRRRNSKRNATSAMAISAPSDTPTPSPTFVPVEVPVSLGGWALAEATGEGPWPPEVGDVSVPGKVEVGLGELIKLDDRLVTELEAVEDAVGAILNPTMAMAPTHDEAAKVLVTVVQSIVRVPPVEAYVTTAPLDISDIQSP